MTETAATPALADLPTSPEALLARLDALGIAYMRHDHPPLFTVEDSKALRGDLPGGHCKNLFLRDRKGAKWLGVCLERSEVRRGGTEWVSTCKSRWAPEH